MVNFSAIAALSLKEFRDLIRDPRVIIPFLIGSLIMPVLGAVLSIPMKYAAEQAMKVKTIAVADFDESHEAKMLMDWLTKYSIPLVEVKGSSNEELARTAAQRGAVAVLVIEPGFSASLAAREKPRVRFVAVAREITLFSSVEGAFIIDAVKRYVEYRLLEGTGLNPDLLRSPLYVNESVYLLPKDIMLQGGYSSLMGLMMAAMFVPIILVSVVLVVVQMAATSMAVENEERTFETLLTLPVSNSEILISKLFGMFSVSLLGTILQIVGLAGYLYLYMGSLTPLMAGGAQAFSLGLIISPADIAYLAISLLLSLFFAAAIGIVVGALSRDVMIANTIVGPLSMLVYLPGFFLAFAPGDLIGGWLKIILYALPFTQSVVAAKDAVGATIPHEAPLYLLVSLGISLASVFLTSKLLSLETLSSLQYRVVRLTARMQRRKTETRVQQ
ncbi:MAG: ABC transporter permease [Thermofilaceae archaeon]